ncbi:MAG: leucine-rich repeat domain-containing protein [Clostridia bacterium]|nr:leucine-rich repeat domain-containing protein [Clostridia bacterium]
MKNEFFKDTRILDAIDHIDSDLIAETVAKIRPPVSPKREAEQSKKTKVFTAWKQAAALVACAVLMGALIPVISMLISHITPASSDFGDGIAPSGGQSENLETESENLNNESEGAVETGAPTERISDGSEGLEYQINADGVSASFIGFGFCTEENIVIASTFKGLPVTQMRNEAFLCGMDPQYCGNSYAKSITVSDTVEEIYQGIFDLCPNLESIYIGANVKFMRPLFASEPKNVYNLKSIEVSPDNQYFFSKGNCLVETQSKILILAYGEAEIPADGSVTTIGEKAFYFYPYKSIVLPEGIETIENEAFSHSSLGSVVLPGNLKKLQAHAFAVCEKLKTVDLNGYTEIPRGAFYNANNLTEIIGFENVTHIGDHAFSACRSLTSITLGTNLSEIGQQAFYANFNLSTINFAGTVEQWNAVKKGVGWNTLMDEPDSQAKIPVELINCSDGVAKP